jgi:hypothetical protein
MKTTIIDILEPQLIGKKIVIYEYDVLHNSSKKRMRHYYTEDEHRKIYENATWSDLKVNELIKEIMDAGGFYEDYEGNDIWVQIETEDGQKTISLKVDHEITLI